MDSFFKRRFKYPVLYHICLFILLLLCPFLTASATIHRTKIWSDINLNGAFLNIPKIRYDLMNQARFNINPDKLETYIIVGGLGYQYLPNLSFWLGGRWNTQNYFSGTRQENWIWQQVLWSIINDDDFLFCNRSRLEERKREGEPQWADRFRNQFLLKFKNVIADRYTPVIWDEIFFNVTRPVWVSHRLFSQNRFFVGIDMPTSKQSYIEVGYMNQYIFRDVEDDMNNVIYLGFYVNT
jgi:hypothetical protein